MESLCFWSCFHFRYHCYKDSELDVLPPTSFLSYLWFLLYYCCSLRTNFFCFWPVKYIPTALRVPSLMRYFYSLLTYTFLSQSMSDMLVIMKPVTSHMGGSERANIPSLHTILFRLHGKIWPGSLVKLGSVASLTWSSWLHSPLPCPWLEKGNVGLLSSCQNPLKIVARCWIVVPLCQIAIYCWLYYSWSW